MNAYVNEPLVLTPKERNYVSEWIEVDPVRGLRYGLRATIACCVAALLGLFIADSMHGIESWMATIGKGLAFTIACLSIVADKFMLDKSWRTQTVPEETTLRRRIARFAELRNEATTNAETLVAFLNDAGFQLPAYATLTPWTFSIGPEDNRFSLEMTKICATLTVTNDRGETAARQITEVHDTNRAWNDDAKRNVALALARVIQEALVRLTTELLICEPVSTKRASY